MFRINKLLCVFGLLVVPHSIYAASVGVCVEGLSFKISSSDKVYTAWKEGFDDFFNSASQGNKQAILDSYSNLDGSRDNIAEQMEEIDKFERYSQTKYSKVEQNALVWGSYWLRKVTYQYRGSDIVFTESMLCERGDCEMSTLTENVDSDSQLINLLLHRLDTSQQASACSTEQKSGVTVKLLPSYRSSEQHPISLEFGLKQAIPLDDLKHIDAYIEKCGLKPPENKSDAKSGDDASIKPGCLSGNIKTLIPVIELGEGGESKTVYMSAEILMRLLATPDSFREGVKLKLSSSETLLLKLKSSVGNEYFVVLPFQSKDQVSLDLMTGAQGVFLLRSEVVAELFSKE
ncbi:hypothetical protein [Alcanivorax sp.]|uniref:hypothetical protein n=1 Tax=Alcanivorax sp. TaxID=1872427 RepID=UPI0025C6576F|nr:hypothetical protein [Alcanivorax sp.]